uniref:Uncharacterized protein n=1 Tax=Timema bartmani TaxID=61472 RepID=A0A7R9F7T4_9NEOP|nr:unnamed protein product [Timema bartmani]
MSSPTEPVFKPRYRSCIKVRGKPILPPLLDDARRGEMHRYKQLAIALECKSYRHMDTRSCSVDSGVVAPSNIVSSCTSDFKSKLGEESSLIRGNQSMIPEVLQITPDSALNDHLDESSRSVTFNHEETLVFRDLQDLTEDQISNVPQEWSSNKGENCGDARLISNQTENLSCLNVTLINTSSVTSENNLLWCKKSNSPQRNYPEGHISTDTSPQGNETVSKEQIAFNSPSIPNEDTHSFINLTSSGNQTLELRMASNLEGDDKVLDISDLTCCPHSARVQENSQPLDETSSSIALTASTDLNQYLHTPVNTSGGSSPSTRHLETSPDIDGLWARRAVDPLPLSVESFKLQQKPLWSGLGLEVLSDETHQNSLLTVQYLNEQVTSPGREPRITDSSSEEYESSCCDVTYETHEAIQNHGTIEDNTKLSHSFVNCQVPATVHTDVSTATSELGTSKDKATLMVEENIGNQIRLATNGQEERSGKSVSCLESIVTRDCVTSYESSSPPRLVRSNSYTLEAPSPILLAHFEQMKMLSASRDSIMQLQAAGSATPKRRKGWHIPSTSLNIVPFSGPQDISVTVPSNALFALPQGKPKLARKVTTHSKGTLTNQQFPYRKSSSLPSTVSSSPVKLNTSFMSVDLLHECNARSEVAKDYCTDTERQPCKLPEQDVRHMLEAVEAKYKQEMAQLLEHQRHQQEKVMMEHKRMLDKLQHQGMPLVAMPESMRLLDLATFQTTQWIDKYPSTHLSLVSLENSGSTSNCFLTDFSSGVSDCAAIAGLKSSPAALKKLLVVHGAMCLANFMALFCAHPHNNCFNSSRLATLVMLPRLPGNRVPLLLQQIFRTCVVVLILPQKLYQSIRVIIQVEHRVEPAVPPGHYWTGEQYCWKVCVFFLEKPDIRAFHFSGV